MRFKKIVLGTVLMIFLGLPLTGCIKDEGEKLKPFQVSYFRHKLMAVCFADAKHGWTAGDQGKILFTTDGGKTWGPQNSGTQHTLRAMSFIDAKHGWMAGGKGTIIKTDDGGLTWKPLNSGTQDDIMCIKFLDEKRGFVGGVFALVLRTEDGGQTWTDMTNQFSEENISEESMSNMSFDEKMKALGDEFQGGEETGESVVPLSPMVNEFFFISALKGWAIGEAGSIWVTKDGGLKWEKQKSGQLEDLFSVFFKDENEGWVTGLNGTLLHTENGGKTWQRQDSNVEQSLFGIAVSGNQGFGVGNAATMIKTEDGGKTWKSFTPVVVKSYSWLRGLTLIKGDQEQQDKYVVVGGLGTLMVKEGDKYWEKRD
jgi:photosystem II stability/assembly factor-like uncharacterized protein